MGSAAKSSARFGGELLQLVRAQILYIRHAGYPLIARIYIGQPKRGAQPAHRFRKLNVAGYGLMPMRHASPRSSRPPASRRVRTSISASRLDVVEQRELTMRHPPPRRVCKPRPLRGISSPTWREPVLACQGTRVDVHP